MSGDEDQFGEHEALDRANMLANMVGEWLAEHPYIACRPVLHGKTLAALELLSEVYQSIGGVHLRTAAPLPAVAAQPAPAKPTAQFINPMEGGARVLWCDVDAVPPGFVPYVPPPPAALSAPSPPAPKPTALFINAMQGVEGAKAAWCNVDAVPTEFAGYALYPLAAAPLPTCPQAVQAGEATRWKRFNVSPEAFKNFHRALCERFGYTHDETDWPRDQVSLIEFIAALSDPGMQTERAVAAERERCAALLRAMWDEREGSHGNRAGPYHDGWTAALDLAERRLVLGPNGATAAPPAPPPAAPPELQAG